jgi:hypothetical protein
LPRLLKPEVFVEATERVAPERHVFLVLPAGRERVEIQF